MPFQHIDQISEFLAGTGITSLELRGPQGHVRLANAAAAAAAPDILVASPGTGHFRHIHPLAGAALAPAGTQVAQGAVFGLLEVGVLLIPVVAPFAGLVAGHLVADGTVVGYGTRLIALHKLTPEAAP